MNLYISNEKINSKGLAGVYRNFRKFLNRFSKEKFLNYQNHKLQSACARFIIVQNNSAKIKQGHAFIFDLPCPLILQCSITTNYSNDNPRKCLLMRKST